MKINIFSTGEDKGTVVQVLQSISYGDEAVIEYSHHSGFQLSTENIIEGLYLLISAIFIFIFLLSIYKIKRLRKKYPETKIEDVSFINTSEKGTPFSFFKSIFWNEAIDLHSKSGQQIFNHEVAHVKEKHSYDKIFMNIVLIFFWTNPFFWLMRKELYMIHEFIADKEALEDSDISSFAEMILQTVYPGQHFSSTSSFFYSPIKRRILMLTKNKNPKVNYISRLLVLPLAAIVFFAFTLKVKNSSTNLYNGKTITVVIDAGHGGKDNGEVSDNGIMEKAITLSIAKKVQALNSNDQIRILLSRDNDEFIPVRERAAFAKKKDANLFISIHVNGSTDKQLNGFSVLMAKNNTKQDQVLGSALINELKKSYKTEDKIAIRNRGVVVLDSSACPAALVECGFLSNLTDAAFINNSADQEKVANNILYAINKYASSNYSDNTAGIDNNEAASAVILKANDTIPTMYYQGEKVKNIAVQSKSKNIKVTEPVIKVTYEDGTTEMISKEEADKRGFVLPPPPPPGLPPSYFKSDALFVIDGKISTRGNFKAVDPKNIESISVLKGKEVIKKYGEKGKNGVIEIITKKNGDIKNVTGTQTYAFTGPNDTLPGKVFTKTEVPASFPGGPSAWQRYIVQKIQASLDSFTKADFGTCVVRFIVNTDGSVIDVQATTMKGTRLAKISVNAIKNGPKWIPASQNGKTVAAYRLQPVTLSNPEEDTKPSGTNPSGKSTSDVSQHNGEKVFIKIQQPASFPGGQSAWLKYITRAIQKNSNELISDKDSRGTCKVKFIVSKDGKVSDVIATTMEGSKLADLAVSTIKRGPYWIPAIQDGHAVNSYVIQPVTFTLNDKIGVENEPE